MVFLKYWKSVGFSIFKNLWDFLNTENCKFSIFKNLHGFQSLKIYGIFKCEWNELIFKLVWKYTIFEIIKISKRHEQSEWNKVSVKFQKNAILKFIKFQIHDFWNHKDFKKTQTKWVEQSERKTLKFTNNFLGRMNSYYTIFVFWKHKF